MVIISFKNSIRRSSVLSLDDLNDEEGEKRLKNEFAITTRATQTKNFSLRVSELVKHIIYLHHKCFYQIM